MLSTKKNAMQLDHKEFIVLVMSVAMCLSLASLSTGNVCYLLYISNCKHINKLITSFQMIIVKFNEVNRCIFFAYLSNPLLLTVCLWVGLDRLFLLPFFAY